MKACNGVYAAGDITTFPLKMLKGELVNIGHWQMSLKHGELESSAACELPSCWSDRSDPWFHFIYWHTADCRLMDTWLSAAHQCHGVEFIAHHLARNGGIVPVIVNKLHCKKVVGRWSADHQPTTFAVQLVHDYLLCLQTVSVVCFSISAAPKRGLASLAATYSCKHGGEYVECQ